MSRPAIDSIDHVVLTCTSIPTTVDFYVTHLGLTHIVDAAGRHALHFGIQKLNLHQVGSEFSPRATLAKPGTVDVCFITQTPIDAVFAYFQQQDDVEIVEDGVVDRTGARGDLKSVYIRDPDGNLIEVANYARITR